MRFGRTAKANMPGVVAPCRRRASAGAAVTWNHLPRRRASAAPPRTGRIHRASAALLRVGSAADRIGHATNPKQTAMIGPATVPNQPRIRTAIATHILSFLCASNSSYFFIPKPRPVLMKSHPATAAQRTQTSQAFIATLFLTSLPRRKRKLHGWMEYSTALTS
jgi:hypothetical protein